MQKKIQDILDRFDFDKARAYMLLTGWGWGFENTVPTIQQLQDKALELLESVVEVYS